MNEVESLKICLGRIQRLKKTRELLEWDKACYAPEGSVKARAEQLVLLETLISDYSTSRELAGLIESASKVVSNDETDPDHQIVQTAVRDFRHDDNLPASIIEEWVRTGNVAMEAWKRARGTNDWGEFAPHLKKIVELNRNIADQVGYRTHPLDALLSMYEPAPSADRMQSLFLELKAAALPLIDSRRSETGTQQAVNGPSVETTHAAMRTLTQRLGYRLDRGRIDVVAHPRTFPVHATDVRIGLHGADAPFASQLTSTLHELGHALYEQGIDERLWDTTAGRGIMPYIHESQSKFWENTVAKTPGFTEKVAESLAGYENEGISYPLIQNALQDHREPNVSLSRIDSGEPAFVLHIILRWEIEWALLEGSMTVEEVPEVWNAKVKEYLGLDVPTDSVGCLQDPHWCHRYFGLFSGYLVGSMANSQIAEAMEASTVNVVQHVNQGDFAGLLDWLRKNIHKNGRFMPFDQLLERATDRGLSAEPFVRYLSAEYATS